MICYWSIYNINFKEFYNCDNSRYAKILCDWSYIKTEGCKAVYMLYDPYSYMGIYVKLGKTMCMIVECAARTEGTKHWSKDRKGRGGAENEVGPKTVSQWVCLARSQPWESKAWWGQGGEGVGEGVGVRKVDGLGSEVGWECQWSSCKKGRRRGGGGSSQRLGRTNPTDGDVCTQLVV